MSRKPPEDANTEWLKKMMLEIGMIRVGMTRADVLKVFTYEGGISTRMQQTYVHRQCRYIKVAFRFQPVPERRDPEGRILGDDAPEDIITEMSRPFLDYPIYD